jgi:hypothetical protein
MCDDGNGFRRRAPILPLTALSKTLAIAVRVFYRRSGEAHNPSTRHFAAEIGSHPRRNHGY